MNQIFKGAVAVALLAVSSVGFANTPDGETPAVETICNTFKGAVGGAFGLCNAFCEAMDCGDPNVYASEMACQKVNDNFAKKFGMRLPEGFNYDENYELINNCAGSPDPDPDPVSP